MHIHTHSYTRKTQSLVGVKFSFNMVQFSGTVSHKLTKNGLTIYEPRKINLSQPFPHAQIISCSCFVANVLFWKMNIFFFTVSNNTDLPFPIFLILSNIYWTTLITLPLHRRL